MTPYTERRNAGHYDPKPVKTPAAEKSTTTQKLSGLTGGKKASARK